MSKRARPLRIEGSIAIITLTQGYEAHIDAADAHLVEAFNWCVLIHPRRNAIYAARATRIPKKQMFLLHRVLTEAPENLQVDHMDGNGLNNRRSNLRLCSRLQNQISKGPRSDNRSGLKGVSWCSKAKKWQSEIMLHGKRKWLGYFAAPEDAHAAYADAAHELHGEFARLK